MAEQVAGIIVGCMPVMPAFFRHFSSDQKNAKSWYANYGINSGFGSGVGGKRKVASQDPYRVTPTLAANAYEELDDLEGRRGYGARNGVTVTGGNGSPFDSSSTPGAGSLEIPDNVAIISRRLAEEESLPRKF